MLSSRAAAIQHIHQHGKMSLVGWVGGENMVHTAIASRKQVTDATVAAMSKAGDTVSLDKCKDDGRGV